MQTNLFTVNEKGTIEANNFTPTESIDERLKKYHTTLEGTNGFCECKARKSKPYEDCTHIKELRLRNQKQLLQTISDHIGEVRDKRDNAVGSLETATNMMIRCREEDMRYLTDLVLMIAKEKGSVCSDDLHTITNESYKDDRIVGTVFAVLLRMGLIVEVGRKPTVRKCAHGRKISIYKLTDKNTFSQTPTNVSTGTQKGVSP